MTSVPVPEHSPIAPALDRGVDDAPRHYGDERRRHWDAVAKRLGGKRTGAGYHRRVEQIYRNVIPPGSRVLEIGCAEGDLLAAVHPAAGLGLDFSDEMVARAQARHP